MKPITKSGEILTNRRKSALERLENQLTLGFKTAKGSSTVKESLSVSDITRIQEEITTLKSKI